jgi:hypothetical protein
MKIGTSWSIVRPPSRIAFASSTRLTSRATSSDRVDPRHCWAWLGREQVHGSGDDAGLSLLVACAEPCPAPRWKYSLKEL